MAQDTNQPNEENAQVNFYLPLKEKQRLSEIAHERTEPGQVDVRMSDVLRDAVRLYLDSYDDDSMPTVDPGKNGLLRTRRSE
jgi:hypothetical protein